MLTIFIQTLSVCNSHSWAQLAKKVSSVDRFCNYIAFKRKSKVRDKDNRDAHGFSMYTTQCPVMLTHCEEAGLGLKHVCMKTRVLMNTISRGFWLGRV